MKRSIFAVLLVGMAIGVSAGITGVQSASCTPSGGLNFI